MNIILTGATGTLGSKVLHTLFETKYNEIKNVYLLVRKKGQSTPKERVLNMLESEYAPQFVKDNLDTINSKVKVINADHILEPESFLDTNEQYYFIHSAGYVNLSVDPANKDEIFEENFHFTKSIFKAYKGYLKKFVYISTAFSIGDLGGIIGDDYIEIEGGAYRNFYEASKHASEKFLTQASKENNIPLQILRPSVLGGNAIDNPSFFISKYMVFYLFAKFFYNTPSSDHIRITANADSGLNIIPTDYVAKVIVKVFNTDVKQLNIVHSKATNITSGISKILDTVGFKTYNVTQDIITKSVGFDSKLEQFYYETIGVHLNPYLTSKPYEWDTSVLESILPIPKYDLEQYLTNTVEFAKLKNFRNQKW
ncbi:SDR family oxidoreductase [Cellulophaga sp. 20_2_10]|uniref:SDR family oxidoreductase n=1 Tax=Cellulophaga sp. 20_2_10 TaxID=2942476 RepID=UPI00201A5CAD|nr:SDR family oxidoreductase [Cellulophaga sp. 20_2_10]MCL5246737.1 SDR family oxidoreductase [Cellulophaga sp. 20_2_10]